MCCIFCEEPVRSITVGLAAVGLVCLINGARKLLKSPASDASNTPASVEAEPPASLEMESAT